VTTNPDAVDAVGSDHPLRLQVPSDTAHLATARLFAAAVGRHYGADEEAIEDLKLGVSEAVAAAAEGDSDGTTTIAVRPDGDAALAVEVSWGRAKQAAGADPTVAAAVVMGLAVVTGLFPDAEMTEEDGGSARVRFTAPLRSTPDEEPPA
jgi:anti-sigma regulatory factor (Ser/Thr protein kinase)